MKDYRRLRIYSPLLWMALVTLWTCNSQQASGHKQAEADSSMNITVEHYQVPCTGMDVQWCLIFREEGDKEWQYSYSDIEGLDYEWGYTYTLEVEPVMEENPEMDSPGGYFRLKKMIRKEKMPPATTFNLVLAQPGVNRTIERIGDQISMMDVQIISDLPASDLDPLFENQSATYIGVFQHTSQKNKIRLLNLKTE